MSFRKWGLAGTCASVLGAAGCTTGLELDLTGGADRDAGAAGSAAGAGGGTVYNNPDAGGGEAGSGPSGPDGGVLPSPMIDAATSDAAEPLCGESTMEAKDIVVQKEIEVAVDVVVTKPVALYIMFDKSLSMSWSNLWEPAVGALKSFVSSDKSQGIGVALQYFPLAGGQCSTGEGYKTPAVPVGILPEHVEAIEASLDGQAPDGGSTPIQGALVGVTEFCKTHQAAHPEEQCVAVLVTDGKPQNARGCEENADKLAAIAKLAHDAGVTTFAVGLQGADFGLLDKIAQQGGAPDCTADDDKTFACDVSGGAEELADALDLIRDKVVKTEIHKQIVTKVEEQKLPCEWAIPEKASNGQRFDRNKVNIRLTTGPEPTTLVRAESLASCQDDSWYYDNPSAPTRFVACPSVCEQIKAASDAKVEVLLGCETLLPQ